MALEGRHALNAAAFGFLEVHRRRVTVLAARVWLKVRRRRGATDMPLPPVSAESEERKSLRAAWVSVRKAQEMMRTNIVFGFVRGAAQSEDFKRAGFNLVMIFAFAVLSDALELLGDEGAFVCKARDLGRLMEASRGSLRWVDYKLIDEGRERRNDIAHRWQTVSIESCLKYIDGIERELIAWRILEGRVSFPNYTISFDPT